MKRTVTVIGAAVAAVLGFVVFSCRSAPKTSSETVAASGWVECTKESVQDCGFFYTTAELGQFSVIEGEFRKDAGYESSGFGFAFGYSAEKGGVLADYIRFEINTVGQYALYAWDGRAFTDLLDATAQNTAYLVDSSAVRSGLGAVNKLKVERALDGTYSCFINGTQVAAGISPLENGTAGVRVFFSVGQEQQENLPDVPVRVSYRITESKAP